MPDFPPTLIHELLLPPCETPQEARDWLDIRRRSLIPCHYSALDFAAINVSCQDDTFRFCGHVPAEWQPVEGQMKREVKIWFEDGRHQHGTPERLDHWLRLFDWWEERGLPVSHYRRQFERFYGTTEFPYFNFSLVECLRRITSGSPVGSVAVDFSLKPGDLVFTSSVISDTPLDQHGLTRYCGSYRRMDGLEMQPVFNPSKSIQTTAAELILANWNREERAAKVWEIACRESTKKHVELRRLLRQSGYSPD